MFRVTKVFEENSKSVAFEICDDNGNKNIVGRQQMLNAISQNLVENAKSYNKAGVQVITVAKNVPKAPYITNENVSKLEDIFKAAIRKSINENPCVKLTGIISQDFCTQGDFNKVNLNNYLQTYRAMVIVPDKAFFASQDSYVRFVADALKGMHYYIGVASLFNMKVVLLGTNRDMILHLISISDEIMSWTSAPVKEARLLEFFEDGREKDYDISSVIWVNRR